MKLINLEKLFVNSWLRSLIIRKLEAPKVFSNLNIDKKSVCLEIGCGRGVGLLLINQYLNCDKVIGIDVDPDMIEQARKFLFQPPRWAKNTRTENIELLSGDATNLNFPDQYFNAVFLLGVLHHIQEWKKVISEIYRILKVDGIFSFGELIIPKFIYHIFKSFKINAIIEEDLIEFLNKLRFSIIGFKKVKLLTTQCYIKAKK